MKGGGWLLTVLPSSLVILVILWTRQILLNMAP